jgi:hypothetical protein
MLVSMIIQDQLEDYGLGVLLYMIVVVLILGSVNLSISIKFKKSAQKIPREVGFIGDRCYIDGQVFGGIGVRKVVMTPERGDGKGDMRKLVFYEKNGIIGEYSFGFRSDRNSFPEYGQLVEAVKAHFGDKFAYDFN